MLEYDDLSSIRVGQIVQVEELPKARRPSYKVQVNFGDEIGEKTSVVGAKSEYTIDQMQNRLVLAVVTFEPRRIAGVKSEVLILGVEAKDGTLSLIEPSRGAKLGVHLY